jgi:RimJ/RimL family protein N-acetyltransferase
MYPLLTERLSIEPLEISDLESFVEYRQDPDVARFQSWDPSYSAKQAIDLINSQSGVILPEPGQWLQLAVHRQLDGELVGDLAIHLIMESESVFELGFTFSRRHQGKGFAKESLERLINYLSQEVGVTRFIASTDERNKPAIKLLSSLGFMNRPEKNWSETFKNEMVTVHYLERVNRP